MTFLLAAMPAATDAVQRASTSTDWVLLLIYLALALGVSFLCSLLEASLLSVPMSHVELMSREGQRGADRLKAMKQDIDRPLAAILTLNTVAHTIGAAGVGAQILVIFGSGAVALGSVVVTLLILVFSEIIPKSLGASKSRQLSGFTAAAVQIMIWMTILLLIPLQWIAKALGSEGSHTISRDEVAVTAELGHSAGVIDPDEINVIRNILALRQITVGSIMTPRPVVFVLQADQTVADVLAEHDELPFTRVPIIENDKDHMIGHVSRPDVLHTAHDQKPHTTMRDLLKPMQEVPEDQDVFETFNQLIKSRHHLLRVVDKFGGTAGVVSLEDCIETILGREIIDETDTAADLRRVAQRLIERKRGGKVEPLVKPDEASPTAPTRGPESPSQPS